MKQFEQYSEQAKDYGDDHFFDLYADNVESPLDPNAIQFHIQMRRGKDAWKHVGLEEWQSLVSERTVLAQHVRTGEIVPMLMVDQFDPVIQHVKGVKVPTHKTFHDHPTGMLGVDLRDHDRQAIRNTEPYMAALPSLLQERAMLEKALALAEMNPDIVPEATALGWQANLMFVEGVLAVNGFMADITLNLEKSFEAPSVFEENVIDDIITIASRAARPLMVAIELMDTQSHIMQSLIDEGTAPQVQYVETSTGGMGDGGAPPRSGSSFDNSSEHADGQGSSRTNVVLRVTSFLTLLYTAGCNLFNSDGTPVENPTDYVILTPPVGEVQPDEVVFFSISEEAAQNAILAWQGKELGDGFTLYDVDGNGHIDWFPFLNGLDAVDINKNPPMPAGSMSVAILETMGPDGGAYSFLLLDNLGMGARALVATNALANPDGTITSDLIDADGTLQAHLVVNTTHDQGKAWATIVYTEPDSASLLPSYELFSIIDTLQFETALIGGKPLFSVLPVPVTPTADAPTETPDPNMPPDATGFDEQTGNYIKKVTENGKTNTFIWTEKTDALTGEIVFSEWTREITDKEGIPIFDSPFDSETNFGIIHVHISDISSKGVNFILKHTNRTSENIGDSDLPSKAVVSFYNRMYGGVNPNGQQSKDFRDAMRAGFINIPFFIGDPNQSHEWNISGTHVFITDWDSLEGVSEFTDPYGTTFRSKILGIDKDGNLMGVIATNVPLNTLNDEEWAIITLSHAAGVADDENQTEQFFSSTLASWLAFADNKNKDSKTWIEQVPDN